VSQRVAARLDGAVGTESIGTLQLKGYPRAMEAFEVPAA
jgi:hypothetical protein